jgi:hypothetical protein
MRFFILLFLATFSAFALPPSSNTNQFTQSNPLSIKSGSVQTNNNLINPTLFEPVLSGDMQAANYNFDQVGSVNGTGWSIDSVGLFSGNGGGLTNLAFPSYALTNKNVGAVTLSSNLITSVSGTIDALVVTNLGTGLSLRINDAASDTTAFIIGDAGSVGIGYTTIANSAVKLYIKNTTSNETPTMGSELLDGTGWTSTDWTGSFAAGYTHTPGNTSALSRTVPVTAGLVYEVTFTMASRTAGSVVLTVGGVSSSPPTGAYTVNSTYYFAPTMSTTGDLIFTPTTDFDGRIHTISVKAVTSVMRPVVQWDDSAAAVALEMRSPLHGLFSMFIGQDSGSKNTHGTYDTGIGTEALKVNTTGNGNSALGAFALSANTTGNENTAVGETSLKDNISGNQNAAFGEDSLNHNTTGSDNTGLGSNAGSENTIGSENVSVGTYANYANTGPGYNTIVGAQAAGLTTSGSTFSNACLFGFQSGYALTTGSSNTFFGYKTGDAATTGGNNILIGHNLDLPTAGTHSYFSFGDVVTGSVATKEATFGGTVTLTNLILTVTNAPPAGFVIGVTVPTMWFRVTNNATTYLIPGYAP